MSQPTNSLAHFRMAEAMFYQKNYQAAANAFRAALGGDLDPKWMEVWGHIYMGKIYDVLGQRERAVNEYSSRSTPMTTLRAPRKKSVKFMKKPYSPDGNTEASAAAAAGSAVPKAAASAPAASSASGTNPAPADASARQ